MVDLGKGRLVEVWCRFRFDTLKMFHFSHFGSQLVEILKSVCLHFGLEKPK